jgi:hypothetical protein
MMEGRGDFAARKKKKTLTDNHTNIIQQPYITLHTKNKTEHYNLTLLALRGQLVLYNGESFFFCRIAAAAAASALLLCCTKKLLLLPKKNSSLYTKNAAALCCSAALPYKKSTKTQASQKSSKTQQASQLCTRVIFVHNYYI